VQTDVVPLADEAVAAEIEVRALAAERLAAAIVAGDADGGVFARDIDDEIRRALGLGGGHQRAAAAHAGEVVDEQ
jgi:hypothetical protein